MGVTHGVPDLTNLNTDVPSQMVSFGYSGDHDGVSYQQIAESILLGSVADVTFSNIPSTYRNLELQVTSRSSDAFLSVDMLIQFNADTANNYDDQRISGAGTVLNATSAQNASSIRFGRSTGATGDANFASSVVLYVFHYADTTFKKGCLSLTSRNATIGAGGMTVDIGAGAWHSTAAITSLRVFPGSGNFVAGSVFTLLGVT